MYHLNFNIKTKIPIQLTYALLYSIIVTIATFSFERLPVFLHMENAIYDQFQNWLTIDNRTDVKFLQYQEALDDLVFINLDSAYFNIETNRIRRDSLASLLEELDKSPLIKGILLDYLFVQIETKEGLNRNDSLLKNSILPLKEKLVLPYELAFDAIPLWGALSSSMISIPSPLLFETDYTGYIAAMPLSGDDSYRYINLYLEEEKLNSAVYALLEVLSKGNASLYTKGIPRNFEVNYILRNREQRTIPIIDASQISSSQSLLDNKIVFIGLFNEIDNKYGLPIDKFHTAVQPNMAGIYVVINTYLNVVANCYIRRLAPIWVFTLNILIALFGAYYFQKNQDLVKSWNQILGEVILSVLFFLLLFFGLFYFFDSKFPFVITTLAYVRNQVFYNSFQFILTKNS